MPGDQKRFQQAMNQGHTAAWDQLWDRAAAFYRQALEELPNHPGALTNLGLALFQLQDFAASLQAYQQAAIQLPNDPLPKEKVAEVYEHLGKLDLACDEYLRAAEAYAKARDLNKAVEVWSRVVSIQPDHLLAHTRLALVYEHTGKKQQAVTEYIAIASLQQKKGEVSKAIQAVTHARQLLPESQEAVRALSMLQTGQPLPRPLRPHTKVDSVVIGRTVQLEAPKDNRPDSGQLDPIAEARKKALAELADLLFEQVDEAESRPGPRTGLRDIVKGAGSTDHKSVDASKIFLHLSQVVELQSQGSDEQALVDLERAIAAGLNRPAAFFDHGWLLFQAGRWEEAFLALQNAVRYSDYALASNLLMAQCLEKLERVQEASQGYLEALKLADTAVVPADQAEEIRQLYEPLIELQPQQSVEECSRLCQNVAGLLLKPDWREGLDRARRQLSTQSGSHAPTISMADLLTLSSGGQLVESLTRINQLARVGLYLAAMEESYYALQLAPTYLPLHNHIAELLLKDNQQQNAIAKLNIIAQSYTSRGQPKQAVDVYRRIIELAPMDLKTRNRLIEQLLAQGQVEPALNEYLQLSDAYYTLADLEMARNTYSTALKLAEDERVRQDWKLKFLRCMADIDMQSLDWRQAVRVYEQIRDLEPGDEGVRSTLINLKFRLGQPAASLTELDDYLSFLAKNRRRNQAHHFLETLIEEDPKQPAFRRRFAEFCRVLGKTDEAIAQLDAAGDLYLEAGDKNGAVESVLAILALNPPNAGEYQALLAKIKAQ